MAKNFSELRAKMSPERQARCNAMVKIFSAEMEKPFGVSRLRDTVASVGGKLEMMIRWPDGTFSECNLAELMEYEPPCGVMHAEEITDMVNTLPEREKFLAVEFIKRLSPGYASNSGDNLTSLYPHQAQ